MNATMRKFGYPASLVAEYPAWVVLQRPQQATLGALVLACKEPVTSFGEVSRAACGELARATRDIEVSLAALFGYDKINYLMLMMVDRDVHFHVLPRYATVREFAGSSFSDPGWPGPPRLDHVNAITTAVAETMLARLIEAWPEVGR